MSERGQQIKIVKYEYLLQRTSDVLKDLILFLGLQCDDRLIARAVDSASFMKVTKGRTIGNDDPLSFYRKGITGDWKNFFSEDNITIFKERAGQLLISLGYEHNNSWTL